MNRTHRFGRGSRTAFAVAGFASATLGFGTVACGRKALVDYVGGRRVCQGRTFSFVEPSARASTAGIYAYERPVFLRRASMMRRIIGVRMSCIASSIFPPGTTMMFGRDMNESGIIESR